MAKARPSLRDGVNRVGGGRVEEVGVVEEVESVEVLDGIWKGVYDEMNLRLCVFEVGVLTVVEGAESVSRTRLL